MIKLADNNPQQVELVKLMASKDKSKALEAREAMAAFITDAVSTILLQAGSTSMIYDTFTYDEDDTPSIPLDLFFSQDIGQVTTWSQSVAGGLPTTLVSGMQELKIGTYPINSAVSILKRYARRARLDVVSAAIDQMFQQVLLRQERNGWAVILKALGEANTAGTAHTINSTAANILQIDDFNRLLTLNRRINAAWTGGTPTETFGITDMFMSPEMKEQIRAMAYQPVNTRNGATTTSGATSLALPDALRQSIFNSAGVQEIYNITLHELLELGVNKKYNVLFGEFDTIAFDPTDKEVLVAVDLNRGSFKRPLARNAETGGTFVAQVDDQWPERSDKMGWYGGLEEGRVCLEARAIAGLIV